MNTLVKTLLMSIALMFSAGASAQKAEYIVKELKGSVEYKLKAGDAWQPAKRLLSLPKSAMLNLGAGAEITVYSQANPQPLRITTTGENRLRSLITEAEKKSAESRGTELAHIFKGHSEQSQTMRSGTSYRGPADQTMLSPLSLAVKSPAPFDKAPIALTLVKDNEGDYSVELSNNSDIPLATAVILKIGDRYSALRISDDASDAGMLILPAGIKITVPECTLIAVDGMQAIAVASKEPFSAETLCLLLNSPADTGNDNGPDTGAVAVEASVR